MPKFDFHYVLKVSTANDKWKSNRPDVRNHEKHNAPTITTGMWLQSNRRKFFKIETIMWHWEGFEKQYVEDLRWTMFDIQWAASLDSPTRLVRIFYMIVTPYLQLQVVVFFTSKWSSSSLPSGRLLHFQVVVFFTSKWSSSSIPSSRLLWNAPQSTGCIA